MDEDVNTPADGNCTGGCEHTGRRDFVLDAIRAGAVALAAVGLMPSPASALPVRVITALSRGTFDKTYPVPASDSVQIDKDNDVILARVGKNVFAFSLACPHQNTALKWEADNQRFQCPKHKSRYRPDGTFIEGRATRGLDRFSIRLSNNQIVVYDILYQEDKEKSAWLGAVVTLP